MLRPARALPAAFALFALLAGCATAPPSETGFMKGVEGVDATAREIQVLLYRFAGHFAGQVDLAAAEIYEGSDDDDVRLAALEWNTNAVAEMMESCFHFDPLAGLIRANIFAVQMDEFFASGNGRDLFGDYQHVAVETSARMRRELYELSVEIWPDGDFEDFKELVLGWARENPIENTRFVRGGFEADMIRRTGASEELGMRLAGSMQAQLLALTDRANILMPHVARQVHWEKEAMLTETRRMVADMTDSTISETMGALGPVLEFLAEQRALTVRDLAHERAAVLDGIAAERTAVLEALAAERSAVLVAITDERNATMQDINTLSLETMDRIAARSSSTVSAAIDQIFDRLTRMLMIPGAVLTVFLVIIALWVRRTVDRMLAAREVR
jgi:hypothetical protein